MPRRYNRRDTSVRLYPPLPMRDRMRSGGRIMIGRVLGLDPREQLPLPGGTDADPADIAFDRRIHRLVLRRVVDDVPRLACPWWLARERTNLDRSLRRREQ